MGVAENMYVLAFAEAFVAYLQSADVRLISQSNWSRGSPNARPGAQRKQDKTGPD